MRIIFIVKITGMTEPKVELLAVTITLIVTVPDLQLRAVFVQLLAVSLTLRVQL